jgi:tRNA A-37 threonylcarbamoyl transferase component Bud32
VACALEQWDRAIDNLQRVDQRHRIYSEVCLILAEILYERGEHDLALERFEEVMSTPVAENVSLERHARYATLLEEAGRIEDAIEVYNQIRRRDRNFPNARERVEELRKKLSEATRVAAQTAAPAASEMGAAPGAALSRYEIVSELGRGAMGIVYKARDTVLDRMVALKKLPESMRQHELAVRFFLREARSAAALNHPNVVTVYDAGQDGDTYFLTMECLEGTSLDEIVRRKGVLTARDTALLGVQAAMGLAYAHQSGIIHRDIKPSNLFYTKDRVVKIMDFGLAKAVEEVRRNATVIAGTPYYMPPEQAEGSVVDHRSDLYAFGVTLFHFCTGRVPFPQGDVSYHHRHTPPPDPRSIVADLPEALAELILQLIAKDPQARPQSSDEVVTRLKTIAQGLGRQG